MGWDHRNTEYLLIGRRPVDLLDGQGTIRRVRDRKIGAPDRAADALQVGHDGHSEQVSATERDRNFTD